MTRERAKELLPVIQAWADGKHIQFNLDFAGWTTEHSENANFALSRIQWRIQPREWWQVCHGPSELYPGQMSEAWKFPNRAAAERYIESRKSLGGYCAIHPGELEHVREVTP